MEEVDVFLPHDNISPTEEKIFRYTKIILQISAIISLIFFIICVIIFISVGFKLTETLNNDILPLAKNITISIGKISNYIENIEIEAGKIGNTLDPLLIAIKQIAKDIHKIVGNFN